jgi:hypothetical protein
MRSALLLLLVLAVLGWGMGCGPEGPAKKPDPKGDLLQLMLAYAGYGGENQEVGPTNPDVWANWTKQRGDPKCLPLIEECKPGGKYVFRWGVDVGREARRHSRVVGYESDAPARGGFVVRTNGSCKKVTAKEFMVLPMAPEGVRR